MYIKIIQLLPGTRFSVFEIVTFLISLGALALSFYQAYLGRKAIEKTEQAIVADTVSRQLSVLPEFNWIINVQARLRAWKTALEQVRAEVKEANETRNESLAQKLSLRAMTSPEEVDISNFEVENIPSFLREILLSGAQYYFNAMGAIKHIWDRDQVNWTYTLPLDERLEDSLRALEALEILISNMVPGVILNTPANISSSEFIRK